MTKNRGLALAMMAVAFAGLSGSAQEQRRDDARSRGPVVGRSIVATTFGIVAASQPLAARAGVQILERGGNAIDAAIAANADDRPDGADRQRHRRRPVHPSITKPRPATVHGLNASGWAPIGLTPSTSSRRRASQEMPQRGIHSVTVPGVVAGWDAMRTRFGTQAVRRAAGAGDLLRRERLSPLRADRQRVGRARSKMHSEHPNSRKTFLIDGMRAPRAGEVFSNPDLAGSLRLIARDGRDGYYKGKTADAILTISREQGGTMTAADLAEFQPEWVTPIKTDYRGLERLRNRAEHAGHRGADDAQPDGAVSARRVRIPQRRGAARDDRSEEAGLRRHAALCRRSEVLATIPVAATAEQAARAGHARG